MPSPPRVGVTIDCPDPDLVASFWERFLGYERRPGQTSGTYVVLENAAGAQGPPQLAFQRVPEPKVGKARAHLDLFVEHAMPMVDDLISAGATPIETVEAGEWTTRILQDPAGNEFCVIGPD